MALFQMYHHVCLWWAFAAIMVQRATSTSHYVAHGATSWGGWDEDYPDYYCQNDDDDQAAYHSSLRDYDIGVGCCSMDGTTGYRPDCNAHPATYDEADALCTSFGYRLCTLQEMMTEITLDLGCLYNAAYQWVSDSCDQPTTQPTADPTQNPTWDPTKNPTANPTTTPTTDPTTNPTWDPTKNPTANPTKTPTLSPSPAPSIAPSISPTAPQDSYHWVTDGSSVQDLESECLLDIASTSSTLNVYDAYDVAASCCELDGSDGARPDCDAYPVTYDEAVQICSDHGYRLCTKAEMAADMTKGKGCSFDHRHNWVSDSCDGTDSYHWATDGSSAQDLVPECLSDTVNSATTLNVHDNYDVAASCCELDGSNGTRPDCDAYNVTYAEAVQICSDHGYRLCTKDEMAADMTKGKGCSFDGRHNWVADPCDATNHYVAHGKTTHFEWDDDVPDYYCQHDDDDQAVYYSSYFDYDIAVGCCSMNGTTGYRPDCNAHPATYDEADALCTSYGYRLCTLQEMMTGITEGKGCSYDAAYQWVSDQCSNSDSSAQSEGHVHLVAPQPSDIGVDTDPWTISLSAKDLVILALIAINLVAVTAAYFVCARSRGDGLRRKYDPVSFIADSELEEVQK